MADATRCAIPLAEIAEGQMLVRSINGREVVICRTQHGIYALDNVCTHAYARLNEGRLRGTRLICPLHGASFDVRDGRPLGAPATRPLTTHDLRIVAGRIEVALRPDAAEPQSG